MNTNKKDTAKANDYDRDYLFRVCGGGKELKNGQFHKRFYESLSLAKIKKGDKVLDVGGGRGEIAYLCSKIGAQTTIIDYSPSSIKIIKKHLSENQTLNKNIKVMLMDVNKLNFKKNSFDKIFFLEVLEHLTKDEVINSILQMMDVLKPEGKLIISTGPNKILLAPLLVISQLFFPNAIWESRKYHINEQSYFTLKDTFDKLGLDYKIYIKETDNWFYGQISENKDISKKIKKIVMYFNYLYDNRLLRLIRSLPLLRKIFCTNFFVEVRKS